MTLNTAACVCLELLCQDWGAAETPAQPCDTRPILFNADIQIQTDMS